MKLFGYDEVEAAMCIWEECLSERARGNDRIFDWLRGGEGAASARNMCILLADSLDFSYHFAVKRYGYDDCFDWDFVPRWIDEVMELLEEDHPLTNNWLHYVAYKVSYDWQNR